MKLFKLVASRSSEIVFDERLEAETPREAREKMKQSLGLESLTGVVYAITEIPLELIREIVTAQMAAITTTRRGMPSVNIPKLVGEAVNAVTGTALVGIQQRMSRLETRKETKRFNPMADAQLPESIADDGSIAIPNVRRRAEIRGIPAPIRAILGPDWKAIKRRYVRDRSVKQTAAQFNVPVNTLKARIRREEWGK
ncbi:MAG: hypothetical protein WCS31_04910 [Verrucomicrobiae bacterium]